MQISQTIKLKSENINKRNIIKQKKNKRNEMKHTGRTHKLQI